MRLSEGLRMFGASTKMPLSSFTLTSEGNSIPKCSKKVSMNSLKAT